MTDLLQLPAEVRGLPADRQQDAHDWAQSAVPVAAVVAHLGQAVAEMAIVNAAAHWLVLSGAVDTSVAGVETVPERVRIGSPMNRGDWAGSPYGDTVAAILARLPRTTGRGRGLPVVV